MRVRLDDFDLRVDLLAGEDEVVGVLGPNGAGKTTLLRALAGLVPLAAGRVVLDDAVLEDAAAGVRVPAHRRPVGVVFQDLRLFGHLSAIDNVAFGLRSRGLDRRAARERANQWLERLGVGGSGADRPDRLSGGQAQRVALARALVGEPRLLLLDEPLAAVDAAARAEVRAELQHHLAHVRGVRLVVTHDPVEAMLLADRLVVLEGGRVTQTGSAAEVGAQPRSEYVARLLGVNLYRGTAADGCITLVGGGVLVAPGAPPGSVLAMVRPQAVALHLTRPAGTPRNVWPGRITAIDGHGDRARIWVDGTPPIVAEVTPAAVAELGLRAGSDVWVAVKATEIDCYPDRPDHAG